jgi:hypothetical protein
MNFTNTADIKKNAIISHNRDRKEIILEFPIIDYMSVSNSEKRNYATDNVPHIMNVSYMIKVVETKDKQHFYFLVCAFTSNLFNNLDFKISRIYNKEDKLLDAAFVGISQNTKLKFSEIVIPNYFIDSRIMSTVNPESKAPYITKEYSINFNAEPAIATIYYAIPLSKEYLLNHKSDGIIIKAYAQGKYGRIFFHISPFYIQGVLDRVDEN